MVIALISFRVYLNTAVVESIDDENVSQNPVTAIQKAEEIQQKLDVVNRNTQKAMEELE